MHAFVSAGAGFLVAVLWFDLMFDVQVRGHAGAVLPVEVLDSISRYYRRVTTNAAPMSRLISAVMLLTLAAIGVEIFRHLTAWRGWFSLAFALAAIGLAGTRTVPNAMRLGRATDALDEQSRLARAIYRDHLFCLGAIVTLLALQLSLVLIG